ncbi:MAG: response regulator [Syntrophaceae bacterium]|jgi:two-component system, chemotaxis family, protein-glutamate methylesterase/glutaminase|nr:response regulator [Syntrophaceae bacterium]
MKSNVRVLVIDANELGRKSLCAILRRESGIEVAGDTAVGRDAVHLVRVCRPDVILMNLDADFREVLEAIENIMCTKATPILLVGRIQDSQKVYEAIRRGAIEMVEKPDASPASVRKFLDRVRLTASLPVITHIRPSGGYGLDKTLEKKTGMDSIDPPSLQVSDLANILSSRVFAIASSTGGPQALALILAQLPTDFPCPVLIAQHISDGFADGMATWLSEICSLPVRLATDGEEAAPGVIYIASPERHCILTAGRRIVLPERYEVDLYRPSCDRLLSSVADVCLSDSVGIILTGMGQDGAAGIARIYQRGGMTIGQDRESSLIYGMNRCAIEAGTIRKVMPVASIASEMIRLAGGGW